MANDKLHQEMLTGIWAEQNPSKCLCQGSGWHLADWEVSYKCPIHCQGAPNPYNEDDTCYECGKKSCCRGNATRWILDPVSGKEMPERYFFNWKEHSIKVHREAFKTFRKWSKMENKEFLSSVREELVKNKNPSPSDWVNAAEGVAEQANFTPNLTGIEGPEFMFENPPTPAQQLKKQEMRWKHGEE